MADVVDTATRSRMMAGIRGRNTRPELRLRKALHARGFRYRLHDRSLPGRPDIVLPKWCAVIEVRGCFWHRHDDCRYATTPSTRPEFWAGKFRGNVARDKRNEHALFAAGWRVCIVWECALRTADIGRHVNAIERWIRSGGTELEIPDSEDGCADC